LFAQFTRRERPGVFQEPIGEGRFPMVNMSDN